MGSGHVGSGVGRGIRGTNHAHGLPHSWTIGTNGKSKEGLLIVVHLEHSSLRSWSLIFYISRNDKGGRFS